MLSTVSVTSGKIFSAAEDKLTSLIGMNIFNNGLKFRIGKDKTFSSIIGAARNVSRDYTLPGRETVRGTFLDNCFENHIKNQREKLLNEADIYGLNFQGDDATIKDTPLLNILSGGFTYLCQYRRLWNVQVTSQVVTTRMIHLLRIFYLIQ